MRKRTKICLPGVAGSRNKAERRNAAGTPAEHPLNIIYIIKINIYKEKKPGVPAFRHFRRRERTFFVAKIFSFFNLKVFLSLFPAERRNFAPKTVLLVDFI
jgi:hypothetical protein